MEDMEKTDGRYALRTPWWDEIRRCAEGDHVPSKVEGWNHPVASASYLLSGGGVVCPTNTLSSYSGCIYYRAKSIASDYCTSFQDT